MNGELEIPDSYEQWRDYIEVRGKIRLAPMYISQRLAELQDDTHAQTIEFARLYGVGHLRRTITWFQRALDEMTVDQK